MGASAAQQIWQRWRGRWMMQIVEAEVKTKQSRSKKMAAKRMAEEVWGQPPAEKGKVVMATW
jgi:hypothetical protein